MKAAIIFGLSCLLCVGCRTGNSQSPRHTASQESVTKKAEQLGLQIEHVGQLAAQWPHRSPEFLGSIQTGRAAWADYLQAEQAQRSLFASSGIVLDREYYRLQEQLLDAFVRQWQQLEDIIVRTP